MVKRYLQFIKEADEVEKQEEMIASESEGDESKSAEYLEVKEHLKELIDKTVEKSGEKSEKFIQKYLKNPKEVKIDGLINDSDIYDFYDKWKNDIDKILNDIRFFDENPKDICGGDGVGIYSYIIKATEKAIFEFLKMK